MRNEIQDNQTTETMNFPQGWNKGDTCVLITNKAKKGTCEYIVESYDGKYFGVRSYTGLYHRVSPWRMFRTREDAIESLEKNDRNKTDLSTIWRESDRL